MSVRRSRHVPTRYILYGCAAAVAAEGGKGLYMLLTAGNVIF